MTRPALTLSLVLGLFLSSFVQAQEQTDIAQLKPEFLAPKIAIVVDDLGYQRASGRTLSQLPYPLTLAVIPDTPHAHEVIEGALLSGQEVILHVPMEPLEEQSWEQGLRTDMDDRDVKNHLEQIFERYPRVRGINNHGGSKLTANLEHMTWVMQTLAERDIFFLDSRTTHKSRAIEAAQLSQVRHATRDVFIDNVQNDSAIDTQFEKLKNLARKHGSAIAIAHPYPITIKQLEKQLPQLEQEGFQLVFCSQLLKSSSNPAHTISLKTSEMHVR